MSKEFKILGWNLKSSKAFPSRINFSKWFLTSPELFLKPSIETSMFWWLFDWCESKVMMDHDVETIAKVLESEVMQVWGAKVYFNKKWH